LDLWLRQCGWSRRTLRVGVSAEIAIPMVAGLRRPTILLPASLLGALNETELDQIGIHEAAHVTRGDDWALVIQRIIEALFPLHPVVRWVARRIDLEREIACDDFVLRASGRAHPYAACLIRLAELTSKVHGSVVAAAVADEGSHLTRRVNILLDKSRHTGTRPLKVPLFAVVAALLGVIRITAQTPGPIAFALPKASAFPLAVLNALPTHAETLWPAAPAAPPASVVPPTGPSSALSGAARPAPGAPPIQAEPPASQPATAEGMTIPVAVQDPTNRFITGPLELVGAIAADSLIFINYSSLASSTAYASSTQLADTTVTIDNLPCPLYYVGAGQVNALVPAELQPGLHRLTLKNSQGQHSVHVMLESVVPTLFHSTGNMNAAALHANYQPISDSNPATIGETITLFATGLGPVTSRNGLLVANTTPTVLINGISGVVSFAGRAPGYQGLDQINVQIPDGVSVGTVGVIIKNNFAPSGFHEPSEDLIGAGEFAARGGNSNLVVLAVK
jgi:uncharacterized protein (TIGR03437 family)